MSKRRHHILLASAQSLSDELLPLKKSKRTDPAVAVDDVSTRPFPVKDLRSRRIFSPPKIELGFPTEDLKSSNCVDLGSDSNVLCETIEEDNGSVSNRIGIGSDDGVGKDSISQNKLVVKTSLRRRVFKVPGSHTYSRLLPFLTHMAKDDTCSFTVSRCTPKTGKFDLAPQNSINEDKGAHSDGLKALENVDMENCGNELSHEAQNLNELNLSKVERDTRSHEDLKGNQKGLSSNGVIKSTKEHSVSKVDEIDLGISSNSSDSNAANAKFSCLVNFSDPKDEDEGTYCLEPLENGNIENFSTLLPCEALDMNQLNFFGSEDGIQLDNNDQNKNENGGSSNGVDRYTEEYIQTTPPEMNILYKLEENMVENVETPNEKIVIENDNIARGDALKDMNQLNFSGSEECLKIAFNREDLDTDQLNLHGSEESIHLDNHGQKRNENGCSASGFDEYTEEHIQTTPPDMNGFSNPITNMVENEEKPKEKIVIENDSIACEDAHKDTHKLNLCRSEEGLNRIFNCEASDRDQLNLSGGKEVIQLDDKDQKINENGSISNLANDYTEKHIQMTPPVMNISPNPEIGMVESPKEKVVLVNNSIACGDRDKDIFLKNGSTFKKKGVLNPCLRRKVFKAPGSFSYRRLLPYLMEVSNDNPRNSADSSNYPLHSKIKTDPEERKLHKHSPVVDLNCQELSYSSKESSKSDLGLNSPTAIPTSKADSADNKLTLVSSKKSIELKKPCDSPNKCTLPVEKVISDILKDLENASGGEDSEINDSPARLSCATDNETMHKDKAQSKSSRGTKALELEHLNQKSTRVEMSLSFDNPVNSKGILRRNPRGCRGLCNCLNCTSFRLNAESAFEFSRNQMLDAEEVVLDLIKELSGLRNMLIESTAENNQVMAAYTKSLKSEEIAKCRLKEMHSDLSTHCRSKLLERPKVRFSDHNKEMVIAEVDLPVGNRTSKSKEK